jgi:transglutaminase-like putative cysteine protease
VTLAIGRDYGDVMPVRGVIRGGGEHSLKVAVSVLPVEHQH